MFKCFFSKIFVYKARVSKKEDIQIFKTLKKMKSQNVHQKNNNNPLCFAGAQPPTPTHH